MSEEKSDEMRGLEQARDFSGALLEALKERGARGDLVRIVSKSDESLRREMDRRRVAANSAREAFPSEIYAAGLFTSELARFGWQIVKDVVPALESVCDLEFLPLLKPGESAVSGGEMLRRATEVKASLGLSDMKFVLDHQAELPAEMRGKCIVFPGTIMRDCYGHEGVAYIYCLTGANWWHVHTAWLDLDTDWRDWGSLYWLLRRKAA